MTSTCVLTSCSPGTGSARFRGAKVESPRRPQRGRKGSTSCRDPVPRRHEHRQEAISEGRLKSLEAETHLIEHALPRAVRPELHRLLTGSRMVAVRVSMLEHGDPAPCLQQAGERRVEALRDHRERERNAGAALDAEQAFELRTRAARIVVPPPQGRRLTLLRPGIELDLQFPPREISHRSAPPPLQKQRCRTAGAVEVDRFRKGSRQGRGGGESAGQALRPEGVGPQHHRDAPGRKQIRTQRLLALSGLRVGDEHRTGAGAQDVGHRVVAGLRDGDVAAREQVGKVGPVPLDPHFRGRLAAEPRNVDSGRSGPTRMRHRRRAWTEIG